MYMGCSSPAFEYLDVQPPCDITALLEKTAVLPDHADVHRDVELLGGEEHVHVVHVLGCAVPTGGEHQHSCNNLERQIREWSFCINLTSSHQ